MVVAAHCYRASRLSQSLHAYRPDYCTVEKAVFDQSGEQPKAAGIVFKDENGNCHHAFQSRNVQSEVIMYSGATGIPQLLLLTGIGPKADLRETQRRWDYKAWVYLESSSKFSQSTDSIRCHHGIGSAEIGQLSTIQPKQRAPEAIKSFDRNKCDLPTRSPATGSSSRS
ncbi:hypothetical protein MLD38_029475 [Melastoma candidum]|uniref:Uncharacterized protein n=1 Tax=Melastoma candidum TaxID=119954 RepID=A0ACB9N513_9MYRT|nr:hypothetical protein MLD38_029475 [Melastoma candidum]